jgi:hypothetical protein
VPPLARLDRVRAGLRVRG